MIRSQFAWFATAAAAGFCLALAPIAWADLFLLQNGGRVEGKLLNPDESPRQSYKVEMTTGGTLILARAQVKKVLTKSQAEIDYDDLLGRTTLDAEGHWKLAEWCRKQDGLEKRREFHLQEVVKLDPEHELARRGLGYSRIDGAWVKPEEQMERFGYERHAGGWRMKQEIEIEKEKKSQDLAEKGWQQKLKMWRSWLAGKKSAEALAAFRDVRDPVAAVALRKMIKIEESREYRLLFIEVLSNLGGAGSAALIETVMNDKDEQVREAALTILAKTKPKIATGAFAGALKSKDNTQVVRAAKGLAAVQDPDSILPLIEALVTEHKFQVQVGRPGGVGASFGGPNQGGGLQAGGGVQTIVKKFNNQAVLEALVSMSGGDNYQFDQEAWRRWFTDRNVPVGLNLRRDE